MALLASHIPVLYCMLYYRTGRHNGTNARDGHLPQRFYSDFTIDDRSPARPGHSGDEVSDSSRRSDVVRTWTYHSRTRDFNKMCSGLNLNAAGLSTKVSGHHDNPNRCSVNHPDDVRRILPERFLSERELQTIASYLSRADLTGDHLSKTHTLVRVVADPRQPAPMRAGAQFDGRSCSPCVTEIGYEVFTEISDFKGNNYTVINFISGFQFVATGRCVNENTACGGGGGAKCKQIYRAQWTLVWAPDLGAQLIAHEVPSHCECLNVGSSSPTGPPLDRPGQWPRQNVN